MMRCSDTMQLENADAMDAGVGYFVHATAGCTWSYNGTPPYTSMSVPLEAGLNMVGWLNCSKDVSDAFSIAGDYYYVASWNAVAQKFKVYNRYHPSAALQRWIEARDTLYLQSRIVRYPQIANAARR